MYLHIITKIYKHLLGDEFTEKSSDAIFFKKLKQKKKT